MSASQPDLTARRRLLEHPLVDAMDWFDKVDSTNTVARTWLQKRTPSQSPSSVVAQAKASEPPQRYLCVADEQTAGRGRSDHAWWSPRGCLMFSYTMPLTGEASLNHQALIALQIGLVIAKTLEPYVRLNPQVKWPNDVYVGEHKIAGVLIEFLPQKQAIIGVGINLSVPLEEAPEAVRLRATSLQFHCDRLPTPEQILWEWLSRWQAERESWQAQPALFRQEWEGYCWLFGRRVEIRSRQQSLVGRCLGIHDDGSLAILDASGITHAIVSGEVQRLADAEPPIATEPA